MLAIEHNLRSPFEGKVRVRVCGLLFKLDTVLLIKHQSVGPLGYLWSPPGGGVEFGQSLNETLQREFLEETNLKIKVGNYLFTNEHIDSKHHAIEIFFQVHYLSGCLKLGHDPELSHENQMISDIHYFTQAELSSLPPKAMHGTLTKKKELEEILDLKGLTRF